MCVASLVKWLVEAARHGRYLLIVTVAVIHSSHIKLTTAGVGAMQKAREGCLLCKHAVCGRELNPPGTQSDSCYFWR